MRPRRERASTTNLPSRFTAAPTLTGGAAPPLPSFASLHVKCNACTASISSAVASQPPPCSLRPRRSAGRCCHRRRCRSRSCCRLRRPRGASSTDQAKQDPTWCASACTNLEPAWLSPKDGHDVRILNPTGQSPSCGGGFGDGLPRQTPGRFGWGTRPTQPTREVGQRPEATLRSRKLDSNRGSPGM